VQVYVKRPEKEVSADIKSRKYKKLKEIKDKEIQK